MADILTAFPGGLNHFPFPQILSISQIFRKENLIGKHKFHIRPHLPQLHGGTD
jgi:hypothetical protein